MSERQEQGVVEQTAITRTDAIATFAAVLREVRDAAGNPSFREMSGRSRAISHTTLHEAAQGNRLPSWSTTVEFVKACGADPADYRDRWQQANRLVASAAASRQARPPLEPMTGAPMTAAVEPALEPVVGPTVEPAAAALEPPSAPAAARPRPRGRRIALGLAAAVVVGVGAAIAVVAGHSDPAPASGTSGRALSSVDCPIRQANPPAALPRHAGDHAAFIDDITLPDCSHVRHGRTVDKVWRFKNIGKVAWTGYSLHRMDLPQRRNQCQTITDVPIERTVPGQVVDVRTTVTTPGSAGFCFVRFTMVDASGAPAFPGGRPVNFQIFVD